MKDINLDEIDGIEFTATEFIAKCQDARNFVHSQNGYGRIVRDPRGFPNIAKLKDEIIPISLYLKHLGDNLEKIKIIWEKGSQKGDAQIFDEKWVMLEVTTARHPNEYLVRHRINQFGGSFTADGLFKNKTGIESKPVVLKNIPNIARYQKWICERIIKKGLVYEGHTIRLIVHVIQDGLILDDEIEQVGNLLNNYELPENIEHVFISFGDDKKSILIRNKENTQQQNSADSQARR